MDIEISGSRIRYAMENFVEDSGGLRFTLLLPPRFGVGGAYYIGDGTSRPFPLIKEQQILAQKNASIITFLDPSGEGFSILTPEGFHEIQDYRVFDQPALAWIYNYQFGKYSKRTGFVFDITSLSPLPDATPPPRFIIDRFGQYAVLDFPEKITDERQLREDADREATDLAAIASTPRDSWGGLPGSRESYNLRATGFFRAGHAGGRHVLVTPEGNVFYQLGVCCVMPDEGMTVVRGRECIFEWLPPAKGGFKAAWQNGDPSTGIVSFHVANIIRKYGSPYDDEAWSGRAVKRLRAWGFNSAGAWSRLTKTMKAVHFAGTPQLPLEPWMAPGLRPMQGAERTYDPFQAGVEEVIDQAFAAQVAPHADDPAIIGWFIENEVLYENISKAVPSQRSDSPSKLRLVQLLREKYEGDITRFNVAWGLTCTGSPESPADFDALKDITLFVATPDAAADMRDFMRLFLEAHYARVERLFRKHAPNHLLLGSRWQPGTASDEQLVRIAARHADIVSVNYYTRTIAPDFLHYVHEWSDGKPLLLSEWHYTATDQGLGGHMEVPNQKERGLAYRNYVENTAVLPFVVGHQWFAYADQPATGRWFEGLNGEAANTGLVNVADRPYLEFIMECKKTNNTIYDLMFR
ncbi:hypothetical protein AW736_05315 [Termitidicoccus mucosus]|uniref:Glycoside hydrolase family 42 N-terminal domain-containing protein n=2 Tax=Termitidicoccus mucosus TaxID=1184151 RepID=A0A178IP89_9BACT|nr:hypothetical protein AW736_05315 [Opitutaceae bacterium TSB47]